MAPELGLFLDECYFEAYSNQWGHQHQRLSLGDYAQEVQAFKVGGPAGRAAGRAGGWASGELWGCVGAHGRARPLRGGSAALPAAI